MEPNYFGLIRGGGEEPMDLLALFFPLREDIDTYSFEIVDPEYIDGSYFKSDGTVTASTSFAYSITDVSKYDYVILPNCCAANLAGYSGLRANASSGALTTKELCFRSGATGNFAAWAMFPVGTTPYACVTASKTQYLPIIGIIKK